MNVNNECHFPLKEGSLMPGVGSRQRMGQAAGMCCPVGHSCPCREQCDVSASSTALPGCGSDGITAPVWQLLIYAIYDSTQAGVLGSFV